MHPMLLLLIAILTPLILIASLLLPPYAGMAGASYLIYNTGAVNPLGTRLADPFYLIDVYMKLFHYWQAHSGNVSLLHYSLPLLALPLAGSIVAFWLTRKLVRKLRDIFHLSASV